MRFVPPATASDEVAPRLSGKITAHNQVRFEAVQRWSEVECAPRRGSGRYRRWSAAGCRTLADIDGVRARGGSSSNNRQRDHRPQNLWHANPNVVSPLPTYVRCCSAEVNNNFDGLNTIIAFSLVFSLRQIKKVIILRRGCRATVVNFGDPGEGYEEICCAARL
jgi:hypothetical protein